MKQSTKFAKRVCFDCPPALRKRADVVARHNNTSRNRWLAAKVKELIEQEEERLGIGRGRKK